MKNREFSETEIATIIRMKEANIEWRIIALSLNASYDGVRHAYYRVMFNQGLPPKIKLPKSKITGRLALISKRIVWDNPQISYRDIPKKVREVVGDDVELPSYKTFENFLKKSGYKILKALEKPLISRINMQKRIDFAKNYSEKHPDFWKYVIWSDETTVRSCPKNKDIFYKVHSSISRENLPVNPQIQQGGFSVMFWGCFSRAGLGTLVAIEGNMNSEKYLSLLENVLLKELEESDCPMIFMQDNASCHTAACVTRFFEENGIERLVWPPQSPDINPIENLWAIIKARLKKQGRIPKNRNELIDQVFAIWNDIDLEILENLSDSIFNRMGV